MPMEVGQGASVPKSRRLRAGRSRERFFPSGFRCLLQLNPTIETFSIAIGPLEANPILSKEPSAAFVVLQRTKNANKKRPLQQARPYTPLVGEPLDKLSARPSILIGADFALAA